MEHYAVEAGLVHSDFSRPLKPLDVLLDLGDGKRSGGHGSTRDFDVRWTDWDDVLTWVIGFENIGMGGWTDGPQLEIDKRALLVDRIRDPFPRVYLLVGVDERDVRQTASLRVYWSCFGDEQCTRGAGPLSIILESKVTMNMALVCAKPCHWTQDYTMLEVHAATGAEMRSPLPRARKSFSRKLMAA